MAQWLTFPGLRSGQARHRDRVRRRGVVPTGVWTTIRKREAGHAYDAHHDRTFSICTNTKVMNFRVVTYRVGTPDPADGADLAPSDPKVYAEGVAAFGFERRGLLAFSRTALALRVTATAGGSRYRPRRGRRCREPSAPQDQK